MLIAHPVANKPKAVAICEAFIAGAPRDAVGHVFYGVNESNVATWRQVRKLGEPWYYLDNSYFDATRGHRFRVARDAVQVSVDGRRTNAQRFRDMGIKLRPYFDGDERSVWLAVEQSPSFMACVAEDPTYLARRLHDLRGVKLRQWSRDKAAASSTLAEDLRQACVLITHSSAAAVEAVIAGVSIWVSPMSALASFATLQQGMADRLADRERVLGVLADHEFTLDEMRDGLPWRTVL